MILPRHLIKQNIWDLDNFITGICDGLQSANSMAKIHPLFNEEGLDGIKPSLSFIEDDLQLVEILAKKPPHDKNQQVWYKIIIETVNI